MLAEWSVECAIDAPVLVVPWKDPDGPGFIDLRADPYDLHQISEAEQHPPLMQALRALNALRSPVFTAKCDAWPLADDEREHLLFNLDLDPAEMVAGFASYIDVIWRDRAVFVSFHQQEQMLHRLTRHASALDRPYAALDCVLRPAFVDLGVPQEGYALSLYIKAVGSDSQLALQEWGSSLAAVVALLRSKELSRAGAARAKTA